MFYITSLISGYSIFTIFDNIINQIKVKLKESETVRKSMRIYAITWYDEDRNVRLWHYGHHLTRWV